MKSKCITYSFFLAVIAGFFALEAQAQQSQLRSRKIKRPANIDIELGKSGTLSGFALDNQGRPITDTTITVKQGLRQIAKAKTDARGHFSVAGIRGGIYEITFSGGSTVVRAWKKGFAPKNAKRLALVMKKAQVVRGQGVLPPAFAADLSTVVATGAIAGGTAYGIKTQQDLDDAEKRIAELTSGGNS